ncbi:hypothetical protein FQR65_LT10138 [Abscondita terminalis]|nr:hypothetical protein FQR65_LT10138 [Abscondita terminalis]
MVGLSTHSNEGLLYKAYSYFVFCTVASSSYCAIYSIFTDLTNEIVLIENFTIGATLFIVYFYVVLSLLASVKIGIGFYNRSNLAKNLRVLQGSNFSPDNKTNDTIESKLLNECFYRCKIQTTVFCTTPWVYLIIANVPCIQYRMKNDSGWYLPYGGFPLWDASYSPNYEFALLYVNICNVENNLKDCLHQLTSIMEITKKFEKMFSFFFLIDFVGLSIIIASCLVYSFMINSYNLKSAQMLTIVFAAVATEFFTTYWGSELVKQYLEIGHCCYEIDFVGTDIRFQKSLRFMTEQTQRPVQFSVGGFSPLTMRTFLLVLKGAYSCFTLLHHRNSN